VFESFEVAMLEANGCQPQAFSPDLAFNSLELRIPMGLFQANLSSPSVRTMFEIGGQ
jgi:hypothetical protein